MAAVPPRSSCRRTRNDIGPVSREAILGPTNFTVKLLMTQCTDEEDGERAGQNSMGGVRAFQVVNANSIHVLCPGDPVLHPSRQENAACRAIAQRYPAVRRRPFDVPAVAHGFVRWGYGDRCDGERQALFHPVIISSCLMEMFAASHAVSPRMVIVGSIRCNTTSSGSRRRTVQM
jgi:hypothetical protein